MATPATRALAEGRMVAGMTPATEAQPTTRLARAKGLPNGAQLAMWKEQERAAAMERAKLRKHNRERRGVTWWKWTIGWAPKKGRHLATHTTHDDPAALCARHGVPNTGRQWRRLRKALARQERAS